MLIVPMSVSTDGYVVPSGQSTKPQQRARPRQPASSPNPRERFGDRSAWGWSCHLSAGVLTATGLQRSDSELAPLHVVPVLLGQGRRLFEGLGPAHIELEPVRTLEGEHGITHQRYRVRRS